MINLDWAGLARAFGSVWNVLLQTWAERPYFFLLMAALVMFGLWVWRRPRGDAR